MKQSNTVNGLLKIAALLLLTGISQTILAQKNRSGVYNGKILLIATTNGFINIKPYTPEVIRVTYQRKAAEQVVSYSTVAQPQMVKAIYADKKGEYTLSTSQLKVAINKANLSIAFIAKNGDTLSTAKGYQQQQDGGQVDFTCNSTEAIYGGGSKGIDLNKRGHILENYNQAHGGYSYGQTDLNISIPLLVSNRNYGLYMDNYAQSKFDVAKTDKHKITFSTTSGLVCFYFIAGNTLDKVVGNYTSLTGRQPLPPRWVLGYITSRYGYKSEKEVMNVVDKSQQAGIPLDGVVMDLYWYKSATLMGNHSWNRDSFPDPPKMLSTLRSKGIKLVPISETYITDKSENFDYASSHNLLTGNISGDGKPYVFKKFWAGRPATLLDIFKPEARQFYWSLYKQRINEGVAGWWFDLGEPEKVSDSLRYSLGSEKQAHNLYALFWAKTAFEGYRKDFPDSRIFTLIRSGFAGMQRYSTFPWSGDINRSFNGLKAQIPIMLNMGLNGVGYMHSDAGGFTGRRVKDPELYSRWLAFASFTPIMRTHAEGYTPEPIFWDDTTRLRVTCFIKLRYAMLPYNYTLTYTNATTGRPLMMPVNYFNDNNQRLADVNDEYLWGEHILVAPVIVKGETQKKVLFPKGNWIGFFDHKMYKDSATVAAPLDSLPLFVKDGSVIPMAPAYMHTEEYNGQEVSLNYYTSGAAGNVTSQWYYDDGKDPKSIANKKYDLVEFVTAATGDKHSVTIKPVHLLKAGKKFTLNVPGYQITNVSFSRPIAKHAGGKSVSFVWDGKPLAISFKITSN
jgi:oligosaccharide 4-alpha-D-glucosyltransferase